MLLLKQGDIADPTGLGMSLLTWSETLEAWCFPILEEGRLAVEKDSPLLFERWIHVLPSSLRMTYMCVAVLYFNRIVPKSLQGNPFLQHFFGLPLYVILVPLFFIYCIFSVFVFVPIVYPLIILWPIFMAAVTDNGQLPLTYRRMIQEGKPIVGTISQVQPVIGNPSKQIVCATYTTNTGATYETTAYILQQNSSVVVGSIVNLLWIPSEPMSGYPADLLRQEQKTWNPRQSLVYWLCTFVPGTVIYYGGLYLYFHFFLSSVASDSFSAILFGGLILCFVNALSMINTMWYSELEKKYLHRGNGARFMARPVRRDTESLGDVQTEENSFIIHLT